MQNLDFYNGASQKNSPPIFSRGEMDLKQEFSQFSPKEQKKHKKKASRMLFLIIAMSIISFTIGIVLGIKFSGGKSTKIVDNQTYNAVSNLGNKVKTFVKQKAKPKKFSVANYPVQEYPFVIRISHDLKQKNAEKVASFLSGRGYTVIISHSQKTYNVYTGPFKTSKIAKLEMKKISGFKNFSFNSQLKILQRQ